jgi:hypothetical protein
MDRQPIRASALEQADEARADTGSVREVQLAPATPMSQQANCPPQRRIIHAVEHRAQALLPDCRRSGASGGCPTGLRPAP